MDARRSPLSGIRHREPCQDVPKLSSALVLLNRNENIIPAVTRLRRDQAVAYFMLGETKGTSAGGAAEAGKNLRVPGTNPFFFDNDAMQGNRLLELLAGMPHLSVYLMNTGAIGGPEGSPDAKKVRIRHSSSVLEAVVSENHRMGDRSRLRIRGRPRTFPVSTTQSSCNPVASTNDKGEWMNIRWWSIA